MIMVKRLSQILVTLLICCMGVTTFFFVSESGLNLLVRWAVPLVPGTLQIGGIEGRLSKALRLKKIVYRDGEIQADVEQFEFSWNPGALMNGTLAIDAMKAHGVILHLPQSQPSSKAPSQPISLEIPSITLPLKITLSDARLENVMIYMGDGPPIPIDALQLQVNAKESIQLLAAVDTPFFDADLKGEAGLDPPHPIALNVNWQGELPAAMLPEIEDDLRYGKGNGEITGTLEKLHFSHHLSRPLNIELKGEIDTPGASSLLVSDLTWQAALHLTDPWTLPAQWSASHAITLSPTTIQAGGGLNKLSVRMNSGVSGEAVPTVQLVLDAGFDVGHQAIDIKSLRLTLPPTEGAVDLKGKVQLQPEPAWDLDLVATRLDPGYQFPQWPGLLDLDLHTDGDFNFNSRGISADLHLKQLAGVLRGYPFRSDGYFSMKNSKTFQLKDFNFHSGDATLHAKAALRERLETLDAEWDLKVPHLEALYPQAAGTLFSKGKISGHLDKPSLNVELQGEGLVFDSFQLDGVNLTAGFFPGGVDQPRPPDRARHDDSEPHDNDDSHEKSSQPGTAVKIDERDGIVKIDEKDRIHLTFSSQNLTQKDAVLYKSADFNINGTVGHHEWSLSIQRPQETLALLASGLYSLENPDVYQVRLEAMKAQTELVGDWQLQQPCPIRLKMDPLLSRLASLQIDKICMAQGNEDKRPWPDAIPATPDHENDTVYFHGKDEGGARLCIAGEWNETGSMAASWELTLSRLNRFLSQAEGKLFCRGEIQGHPTHPKMEIRLNGEALGFDGLTLEGIDLDVAMLPHDAASPKINGQDQVDLQLSCGKLMQNKTPLWEALTIGNQGTIGNHRWLLDLKRVHEELSTALDGRYKVENPHEYQLVLQQLNAMSKVVGDWQLQHSSRIEIGMEKGAAGTEIASVLLDETCLGRESASVCLEGKWAPKDESRLMCRLGRIPLGLAKSFLPEEIQLQADLSGEMAALLKPGGKEMDADLSLQVSSGSITLPVEEVPRSFPIQGGKVALHLDGEQGLRSQLEMALLEDSHINAEIHLPRQTSTSFTLKQPVQGTIGIQFSDLQIVSALVEPVAKSEGEVILDATLDGTLDAPQMTGVLHGKGVRAEIPELGVTVEQFDLNARGDGENGIDITASLVSGGGYLDTTGRITLGENALWQVDLDVEGNDLEVIDTPDVRAAVSPDLTLMANPEGISLKGKVVIPKAQITPNVTISGNKGGGSMIHESDDVVIVNPVAKASGSDKDSVSEPNAPPKQSTSLPLDLSVEVVLGPDVTIDVVDFKSRLGGALQLNLMPGERMPQGTGEVQIIGGTYRAYGQDLEIPRGRVLFSGGDLTNPGLNITAIRTIYQDKSSYNVKQAGVQITGRVQNPHLRLFSDPMVENTQILSYIVTGAAMNTDKKSTVSLGTYLTPRLYVSAGFSLFDQSKVFNLRYELNRKWGVEANVGDLDSGMDISYTIGR